MLDDQDISVILRMLEVCYSEGIGPPERSVSRLLQKIINKKHIPILKAYDYIPEVAQLMKELA